MAFWGAAIIGALAAFLVPWMAQATTESFNRLVQSATIAIPVGANHLMWSWPAFIIVTFLAWVLLKASE